MKLFLCVLTILLQHFITSFGGVTKNSKKEPKKLYQLMCQDLTEAIEYRKTAFWQKLAKIDYTKVHEKVLSKYMEWQIRYASIERLFKYCEYLTKCENNIYAKYYYFRNENKSLKHIALKPTFTSTNDGLLPIKEVMTNIVLAFQIILMSKKEKCLEKCFKICMDKKELVEMHFENKDECVKVLAWAHHLGSSQHIEDALNNLRNVKTYLLSAAVNEKVVKLVMNMPPPLIAEHSENSSKNVHKIRTNNGTYTEHNSVDQFIDQLQFQLMMAQLSNTRSSGGTSAAGGSGGGDGFFCCINCPDDCCKGFGACCGACCKGCGACCGECCKSFGECCKGFGECCKGFGECCKSCGEGCKGFVEGCCCECCKNCSECCKSFGECCKGCCECCKGCKDCCEGFGQCCKNFGECCNGCCECCKNCSECCTSFGECCKGCCACCKDCSECCKGLGECCKGLGECCKGCGECCKGLGECCKGCGECCQVR